MHEKKPGIAPPARDWDQVERRTLRDWGRVSTDRRLRVAEELYAEARLQHPDWPTDAERRADVAHHQRVSALLRKAGGILPR